MKLDSVLIDSLLANGPAADRAKQMMLYGQFVGSWDGRLIDHSPDGTSREMSAEVHFGWALAGRAVQDVWIAPSRTARSASDVERMYGTTLRVYDPSTDVWQITWIDPVRQAFNRMTGRKVGDEIVQEYRNDQGIRFQWMFTDITTASFHWLARSSADDGGSWVVRAEFFFRRRREAG